VNPVEEAVRIGFDNLTNNVLLAICGLMVVVGVLLVVDSFRERK
jgi:hypothetical protein